MKAKEMFKKLGFEEYNNDNISVSYRSEAKRENTIYMVTFYFSDNSYQVYSVSYSSRLLKKRKYLPIYEPYRIGRSMHQAIIQQCKELGWL